MSTWWMNTRSPSWVTSKKRQVDTGHGVSDKNWDPTKVTFDGRTNSWNRSYNGYHG